MMTDITLLDADTLDFVRKLLFEEVERYDAVCKAWEHDPESDVREKYLLKREAATMSYLAVVAVINKREQFMEAAA